MPQHGKKNVVSALGQGAILTIDYGENGQVGKRSTVSVMNYGIVEGADIYGDQDMLASYRALGKIDITARIDFKVLEQIALEEGLKIAFSDIQPEFLCRHGLDEEVERLREVWHETNTQDDKKNYEYASGALMRKNFYVSMVTRGLML